MVEKGDLREDFLGRRERISEGETRAASAAIEERLFGTDFYRDAAALFVYYGVGKEAGTEGIILRALGDGKTVCLPRTMAGGGMEAVPLEDAAAYRDAQAGWRQVHGIPEPPQGIPAFEPAELDLVIVPSLAVDKDGYRIGYGGGYYDRWIAAVRKGRRPVILAVQYEAFVVQTPLPREAFDMPVDVIVTEARTLNLL